MLYEEEMEEIMSHLLFHFPDITIKRWSHLSLLFINNLHNLKLITVEALLLFLNVSKLCSDRGRTFLLFSIITSPVVLVCPSRTATLILSNLRISFVSCKLKVKLPFFYEILRRDWKFSKSRLLL